MARIIGGFTTSHIPAIGNAMEKGLQQEPYWKPFFDGYLPVRMWMKEMKPDVAVIFYNDHGLNFFLDHISTFAVGAAAHYYNGDEGWGLPTLPPVPGDLELSWHLINSLVADEFDIAMCQEMMVDHGLIVPISLALPHDGEWPVRVVPIAINTVQHPVPSAARCYKLGQAVGRALDTYEEDLKIVVFGTGGMSHQLQGERAGYINKKFDRMFMDKLESDPLSLTRYSISQLMEIAGSEGVELIMWLAMRGALTGKVRTLHSNYHIPISNTGAGVLLLENAA